MEEEQANELEALGAIFPEEFEIVDAGPPASLSLRLTWSPETLRQRLPFRPDLLPPGGQIDTGFSLSLDVKYTPTYPDTLPSIAFSRVSQDSEDEDAKDIFTEEDLESLTQQTIDYAESSLCGMAMVFALSEFATECLLDILNTRIEKEAAAIDAEEEAKEAAERARTAGTKVTRESFAAWRTSFLAESKALAASGAVLTGAMAAMVAVAMSGSMDNSTTKSGGAKKLTGRQLFERDTALATADMALLDDTDVAVDITLFEGLAIDDEGNDEEDQGVLAGLSLED